jgi:uncharacterized glyoxalase superfamily protein PhnB
MENVNETRFLHISPVLASANVQRDVDWYEEKLGFKNVYDSSKYQEGPLDYAVLRRQNLIIHLQFQFQDDMTSTDVKIEVQNIDPLFDEYVTAGIVKPDAMIRKTPWNTFEFGLFDASGNRITFIEDI